MKTQSPRTQKHSSGVREASPGGGALGYVEEFPLLKRGDCGGLEWFIEVNSINTLLKLGGIGEVRILASSPTH